MLSGGRVKPQQQNVFAPSVVESMSGACDALLLLPDPAHLLSTSLPPRFFPTLPCSQQDLEAAAPLVTSLTLGSSSSSSGSNAPPAAAGGSSTTAAAAAGSHAVLVGEAGRRLVQVLLVAAGRVPAAALPSAELLLSVSPGCAELLLQQLDLLLQVSGRC
jgi:hypothetical protein